MFNISTKIARYARNNKYFISTSRYNTIYTIACIVKFIEVFSIVAFFTLTIWFLSLI